MKLTSLFLSLFLLIHSFCFYQEDWKIQIETYSSSKAARTERLKCLHEIHLESHKTLIRFHELPKADGYILKFQRLLLKGSMTDHELETKVLHISQDYLKESVPCFALYSSGYLPVKVVDFWIETKNKDLKSDKIRFIPQLVHIKSLSGEMSLTAELTEGFSYNLFLTGLKEGEEFTFASDSLGEKLEKNLKFSKEIRVRGAQLPKVTLAYWTHNHSLKL